jgi:CheY-like chemotaxis protein
VLVVENFPVHRELAAALQQIAPPNVAVTGKAVGFDTLIAVGQQNFDLVIANVVMSNMNGFEMLRHMAACGPQRSRWQLATFSHSLA